MSPPSASHAEAGRIGRYPLLAKIGEGGMGVVHLVEGAGGERLALKVLRPHVVGDDEGRARLAREVSSLRRVRSRRVAEVYDADPWGERPYLVTRYVDGPSLHERVREAGPLAGDELRALAVGLAEAVIAVHEAGVLHRDVKPSNVLIEGEHDPVLIDFGLAKVSEDSRLTATGFLMGTPGFLAPEVLYGEEATPAADVHAWAATTVFAATGDSPFGRGPSMAVMDRARRGEYDLSGVPEWLQPLLGRCLSPDPAERPSAHDVLVQLSDPPRPAPAAAPAAAPPTRPITVAHPYPPPRPLQRPTPRPSGPAPARRSNPVIRVLLMLGLLGLFATGVALAPYVAAAVTFVVAWLVRTASWSMDAMADRRALRGQRKSDGVVRALTAPWYLVVSLAGSVVLLVVACAAAALLATVLWAVGVQDSRALFAGGLLGGLALWWGPGGRRLRRPTRRAVWTAAQGETAGVAGVGIVLGAVVVLLLAVASAGVQWWPDTGPPFDPRALLPPGFQ
ncbi:MAG TPA: serine/threonine-protein kinase [Nocardioidaceae bacterium]|nr:serine/threonine-protein kinase [Nocardioidaceae bacterium]